MATPALYGCCLDHICFSVFIIFQLKYACLTLKCISCKEHTDYGLLHVSFDIVRYVCYSIFLCYETTAKQI